MKEKYFRWLPHSNFELNWFVTVNTKRVTTSFQKKTFLENSKEISKQKLLMNLKEDELSALKALGALLACNICQKIGQAGLNCCSDCRRRVCESCRINVSSCQFCSGKRKLGTSSHRRLLESVAAAYINLSHHIEEQKASKDGDNTETVHFANNGSEEEIPNDTNPAVQSSEEEAKKCVIYSEIKSGLRSMPVNGTFTSLSPPASSSSLASPTQSLASQDGPLPTVACTSGVSNYDDIAIKVTLGSDAYHPLALSNSESVTQSLDYHRDNSRTYEIISTTPRAEALAVVQEPEGRAGELEGAPLSKCSEIPLSSEELFTTLQPPTFSADESESIALWGQEV